MEARRWKAETCPECGHEFVSTPPFDFCEPCAHRGLLAAARRLGEQAAARYEEAFMRALMREEENAK